MQNKQFAGKTFFKYRGKLFYSIWLIESMFLLVCSIFFFFFSFFFFFFLLLLGEDVEAS
jgi:hypothetical protein